LVEPELRDERLDGDDALMWLDRVEAHGAQEGRLAGVVIAGHDEVLAGAERGDDEVARCGGQHAEADEVVHRHGEVAVSSDRQQRFCCHAVAGIAAEDSEQARPVGQLEVELRMAGVEVHLVGAELPRGATDQIDQLVLVGGDRCPPHALATDEGHKHLGRSVDVDVLDLRIRPECVQLAEPVDVCHHGIEHRLVGVVRERRLPSAQACLVDAGELAVDLGDGRDLLGVARHPRAGVE
jgi:hypothetical protein